MSHNQNRQGRQPFGHQNRPPSRAASVTPSQAPSHAGSTTSKRGGRKKKSKTTGDQKQNAAPDAQAVAAARALLTKIYGAKPNKSFGAQKNKGAQKYKDSLLDAENKDVDVMPNKSANDVPVNKDNIVRNDFAYAQKKNKDGHWSNYPVCLPPRFTVDIMVALRKSLGTINNDHLLRYFGGRDGNKWEYGALDCYEGITEDAPGNFLSCDFVNPKYIREMKKPLEFRQKFTPWLWNYSSFVYAPVGSILSGGVPFTDEKTSIPLTKAQSNWIQYARNPSSVPQTVSASAWNPDVVAHFWLYKEVFIDFENRPKDPTHPKFETIKSKGRIGMFFPIHPIELTDDHHLKWMDVQEDSVGWGTVGKIGAALQTDQIPTTWKNLQSMIGKYILLTNVWSSEEHDEYEVFVDPQTVKVLYKSVCEMTKGDMFVNVRRGSVAYGSLCVLRRNIVVDPRDAKFGLPPTERGKLDLYVTQIMTCEQSLTQNLVRKEMMKQYWKQQGLSDEEQSMCSIVQRFYSNLIERMKNEAYRNMMKTYWEESDNRIPGMMDGEWNIQNMKILMLNMLSTAYNLLLEKGVCKVACGQRYMYLSHIFTNYPKWFQNSKCLPDDQFLTNYKISLIEEQVDAQSFAGMYTKYINQNATSGVPEDNARPSIDRPSAEEINGYIKMPQAVLPAYQAPTADNSNAISVEPQTLEQQKAYEEKMAQKIKAGIRIAARSYINEWLQQQVPVAETAKLSRKPGLVQMDQMRNKFAHDVYALMLMDSASDAVEDKFERYFQQLYPKFWTEMNRPEYRSSWLDQEERAAVTANT